MVCWYRSPKGGETRLNHRAEQVAVNADFLIRSPCIWCSRVVSLKKGFQSIRTIIQGYSTDASWNFDRFWTNGKASRHRTLIWQLYHKGMHKIPARAAKIPFGFPWHIQNLKAVGSTSLALGLSPRWPSLNPARNPCTFWRTRPGTRRRNSWSYS